MDATRDRLLAPLGVSDFDERVYRLLLTRPRATQQELAAEGVAGTDRLGPALRRLEELGFVGHLEGRPRRYVPTMPDLAIESLVHVRESELLQARAAIDDLTAEYRAGRRDDPGELVEILTGERAVAERFAELQESCTSELLLFDRPPYAAPPDNPQQDAVLARGVQWRTIYSPESLERVDARSYVRGLAAAGEQARLLPQLPMKLVIVDRRAALMPLTLETGIQQSALIHRSTLLDALVMLFDVFWSRALPIGERPVDENSGGVDGSAGGLGAEDRRVLALLATGAKDEAIARELGIAVRTLRRRMTHLLDELDADTRFQAGMQAVRRGWL